MSQVIEVRFVNPPDGGVFFDRMVLPSSKTPRHREHREAIEMWLDVFADMRDAIELKQMTQIDEKFNRAGNGYWRYVYACTLGLEDEDREMLAVLFTTYRSPDRVGMEVQSNNKQNREI